MCTLKRSGLHVHKTGQSPLAPYARGNISSAERPQIWGRRSKQGGAVGGSLRGGGKVWARSTVRRVGPLNQDGRSATLMRVDKIFEKDSWSGLAHTHSTYRAPVPSEIPVIDEVVDSE